MEELPESHVFEVDAVAAAGAAENSCIPLSFNILSSLAAGVVQGPSTAGSTVSYLCSDFVKAASFTVSAVL